MVVYFVVKEFEDMVLSYVREVEFGGRFRTGRYFVRPRDGVA